MPKKDNPEMDSFEKDLCNFYEFCKENSFTAEEMYQICKPLTLMVFKYKLRRLLQFMVYLIIILTILYMFLKTETVSWHVSAIGRILLIKLLPVWDWEQLFGEKCLIQNRFLSRPEPTFDCTLCEAIDSIPVEMDAEPEKISEFYLKVDIPVIISDGLKNWGIYENASLDLRKEILSDEIISESYPCSVATNMFSTTTSMDQNVKTILLQSEKFMKWFFHFQNCEIDAVKQLRLIIPRPYFLIPEISPVQYSWLLMSLNYNSPKFKRIDLREKISVFAQIRGTYTIKLTPRLNCLEECPTLETDLEAGEAILFSSMWDLEYKPNKEFLNVAVILEMY